MRKLEPARPAGEWVDGPHPLAPALYSPSSRVRVVPDIIQTHSRPVDVTATLRFTGGNRPGSRVSSPPFPLLFLFGFADGTIRLNNRHWRTRVIYDPGQSSRQSREARFRAFRNDRRRLRYPDTRHAFLDRRRIRRPGAFSHLDFIKSIGTWLVFVRFTFDISVIRAHFETHRGPVTNALFVQYLFNSGNSLISNNPVLTGLHPGLRTATVTRRFIFLLNFLSVRNNFWLPEIPRFRQRLFLNEYRKQECQ